MSKSLRRLEHLRAKLHKQAQLVVQRTQTEVQAADAARLALHEAMAEAKVHGGAELLHQEHLREQFLDAGKMLMERLSSERHDLRERARDFKQVEKVVADRDRRADERRERDQERLIETWLRSLSSKEGDE